MASVGDAGLPLEFFFESANRPSDQWGEPLPPNVRMPPAEVSVLKST